MARTEDLEGLRKPLLVAIAETTGAVEVNAASKLADLTQAITRRCGKVNYVVPTLRFGTTKSLETTLAKALK